MSVPLMSASRANSVALSNAGQFDVRWASGRLGGTDIGGRLVPVIDATTGNGLISRGEVRGVPTGKFIG
jgi:hypothetical protein